MNDCPLCQIDGGELVYRDDKLRVVLADEPQYPAFTRVIWNAHCAEMTDLQEASRQMLMNRVFEVERIMRDIMMPDKINLASLGNQVAHLHWHVIPRYRDDPGFPDAVWAAPSRQADPARLASRLADYRVALMAM